jgi:phosphoglycolate phosphatase-like HAD superfamily hydrolase
VKLHGVIWDVDGTLVNSNDAHARAWQSALSEFNLYVSFESVRAAIGMGGDKLLPAVAGIEAESAQGRAVSARRAEIFAAELPKLRAFPQGRRLLLRLADWGIKHAVASSAQRQELDALLEIAEIKDLLVETSSAASGRSKPDPDIVRAALEALGFEPEEVVMVGDTPYDIEAASRVGVRTIALRSGGRSDQDLAAAIAIYDSPSALLEQLEDSPLRAH